MPNLKNIDMPWNLEMVYWYQDGQRCNPRERKFAMCISSDPRNGMITAYTFLPGKGRNSVIVDPVPHISDPRLGNPEAGKHAGAWELTEMGVELRLFMREHTQLYGQITDAIANRKADEDDS